MNLKQIILSTFLLFAGCNETLKDKTPQNPIYQKPIPQNPAPAPEKPRIIVNYTIPEEKPKESIELTLRNTKYSFIPAKDKFESNILNIYDANNILKEEIIDFDRNGKIGDFFDSYTIFENKDIETIYTTAYILHKEPNPKNWRLNENPTKEELKQAFDKANQTYSYFLKNLEGKDKKEDVNN